MLRSIVTAVVLFTAAASSSAQLSPEAQAAREAAYYMMETVPIPDGVELEVGGLAFMPSGDLAVATRRGEVWMIENPNGWGRNRPYFRLFARGLHEPLGLAYRDGSLYAAQRGELTRLNDSDGDGQAEVYETVFDWPVSGNYHEYAFGPVIRPNGNMVVSLNLGSFDEMQSVVKWRGWMIEVTPEGAMQPIATGMRSPAGFTITRSGDIFYSENQGDWIGSGWVTHVEPGDFVGNPQGLQWSGEPGVPEPLRGLRPDDIPNTGEPMFAVAQRVPQLKPPAVWFPHGIVGVSTSGILEDTTGGAFGPFSGQLFVGDQGHSKIMRMALEQVEGVYQGVVFPFREGFQSGVLRMVWSRDNEMYVGMTSRGWDATGGDPFGLQRLRWTGLVPFEAKTVRSKPDGFEIGFTMPAEGAGNPASYQVTSFTYKYHRTYGSPVIEQQEHAVRGVETSEDGRTARIAIDGIREGYIYEIKMAGLRSPDGDPLLHDTGYFTLNRIPDGDRMTVTEAPPRRREEVVPEDRRTFVDVHVTEQPKRLTAMPWERPDVTITLGTVPGLRFDIGSFTVAPGARIEFVFNNTDDMLHNAVIVRPGTTDKVALEAMNLGLKGAEKGYVPDSDDVLFHTALLQPGSSDSIYFTAPTDPGEYPFVCTFPGHAFTMRGTMVVTP